MAPGEDFRPESVRAGYDRWAEVYDHDGNPLVALEEATLAPLLGPVADLEALDLGCGTGRHALRLAAMGARVTALDFSEGMLAQARAKAEGLPMAHPTAFRVHDLREALPCPDAAFDLAVSGLVLEHLPDLEGFFREIRRVLHPGGRALVSAMHPALFLKGKQAAFTDPATGEKVRPGSLPHGLGAFVMAALRAGLDLDDVLEVAPDAAFIARWPRAAPYLDWPMLAVLALRA